MIRAAQPAMNYTTTKPITLTSFCVSLVLVTINIIINTFVFTKFPTYTVTSIQATVYALTLTSAALLLASMLYACIGIVTLLKACSTNYRPKISLPILVLPIYISYVCLCIAFSVFEPFNTNAMLSIVMSLELPVLILLAYCIVRIHNIESSLNQARAAHNVRYNSSTTIDSGYMSYVSSCSGSNLSISYDEVSLSISPDLNEEPPNIPYIDDLGSQEDMRTAMTTSM